MNVSSRPAAVVRPLVIKSMIAGVRFGAPGKNCKGSGICEVFEFKSEATLKTCKCKQVARIIARGKYSLEFRFLNREIQETVRKKYFANNLFLVEEDVEMPNFLRSQLGLRVKTLSRGIYTIRYYKNYTSIIVRLKRP